MTRVSFFLLLAGTLAASGPARGQWVKTSFTPTTHVEELVLADTVLYAATYGSGVFRSTNNGATWLPRNTGLGSFSVTGLAQADTLLFAGAWPGGVYRSTNSGANWVAASSGLANTNVQALAYVADSASSALLAGTFGGGAFRSTDRGASWSPSDSGMPRSGINAFLSAGELLFAGTDSGLFASSDRGRSWRASGLDTLSVWTLARDGAALYAGVNGDSGGVFLSSDSGWSWSAIGAGLPVRNVWAVAARGALIAAGTIGGGVFVSTDGGASWRDESAGLTSLNVQSFAFSPDGAALFAGTDHVGIWKRPLAELTTGVAPGSAPLELPGWFALRQNYPNPFNPSTVIGFTLPREERVTLAVFDLLGREVARLAGGVLPPGRHERAWDASSLPGGVYFCRLEAAGRALTRKLLLVR